MKVAFKQSEKQREANVLNAIAAGIKAKGDQVIECKGDLADVDCDAAIFFGMKSRDEWNSIPHTVQRIYVDKGYVRRSNGWRWLRFSIHEPQPVNYVRTAKNGHKRWKACAEACELELAPWRKRGSHIVIAGSSLKYHLWHGLPHPTEYAQSLVEYLRRFDRRIYYRPKPSWKEAVPVPGSKFSGRDQVIADLLEDAHCLVTYGSNSCFDAVRAGVPSVILGDGIAGPISSTSLDEVENPRRASDEERKQWAWNLAYCQWELSEFQSGKAWMWARDQLA